jgi:murein DD-endopeptidase MepM/ murein hydrolase activator NlpD
MPGKPSVPDLVRRTPLSALSPRGRALAAAGVVGTLALAALTVAPRDQALPGAAAAATEREVVSVDVEDGADGPVYLSTVLTSAKLAATARRTTSTTSKAAKAAPTRVVRVVAAAPSSFPTLRPGDKGRAVAYVQRRLGVKTTGWYGPATLGAVVAFQKGRGLPAKGIVGPLTWRALVASRSAAPAARTVARTAKAATVRRVSAPVTAGRVCPAPGAAFGDGWGAARGGHRHQGMDLMGRRGMPILAIEDGVVIREGRQGNGALRIVMQGRSGSKFYYGHMSKDLVHAGSRVKRGQVIGLMGDTGSPGAVHLHFEYWRSGGESAAVDAEPLLRRLC